MDDTTKLLLQIVQDIAEMKTDIRNMKDKLDEADTKCINCETAKMLEAHLKEHEIKKNDNWKHFSFWLPFIVSIGALAISIIIKL